MSTPIVLPDGIEWTALALFSTQILLYAQEIIVGKHRRLAKVPYPQLYAEKTEVEASKAAYTFNCAQRAHQNTLENIPIVFVGTLISAIQYPIFSAVSCGLWVLGRALYTRGYLADASLRNKNGGVIGTLGQVAVVLGSGTVVFNLVKARLGF